MFQHSGRGRGYDFVELSDGSALYVPVLHWYTPNGKWIGGDGVQPDILVEYEEVPIGPAGEMQFNTAYEYLDSRLPLFR